MKIEAANLRRRDIDVVRSRKVVVLRCAQESESLRQNLEHALSKYEPFGLGLMLEDAEDEILPAHAGWFFDPQSLGYLAQLADAHLLELVEVEASFGQMVLGLLALFDFFLEVEGDHHRFVFFVLLLVTSHLVLSVAVLSSDSRDRQYS